MGIFFYKDCPLSAALWPQGQRAASGRRTVTGNLKLENHIFACLGGWAMFLGCQNTFLHHDLDFFCIETSIFFFPVILLVDVLIECGGMGNFFPLPGQSVTNTLV